MVTAIVTFLSIVGKLLGIAAKIALNRVTIILTLLASIGSTVALICTQLEDSSSFLYDASSSINDVSQQISNYFANNEYGQLIGYGLSLDVLTDGVVSSFIWIVCTVSGVLFTAAVGALIATAPLLSELVVSGIKSQFAKDIQL